MIVYEILFLFFFFFNDTATTEIYTLSLHDALPILHAVAGCPGMADGEGDGGTPRRVREMAPGPTSGGADQDEARRSEEHTSELQSRQYLVCRLLLEKKKKIKSKHSHL